MPDLKAAPLFLPALAWLAGLLLARSLPPSTPSTGALFFALWALPLLAMAGAWGHRPAARRGAWLGLIALAGAFRGALRPTPTLPPDLMAAITTGTEIPVEGIVVDDPAARGPGSRFRFRPEGATGFLLVDLPQGRPAYGDRLRLIGRPGPIPLHPEVDMRAVLARQGVVGMFSAREWARLSAGAGNPLLGALYRLRGHLRERLRALLPDPEAGLLLGILLGDESEIPREVETAFARAGLSHIVAISGYNIALLTALALTAFTRLLGRRAALWGTLILIPLYTLLVGASASVVRAAWMGALTVLAALLGRSSETLNALSLSALLMTAIDPWALEDIGFQLSFAATLGLLFLAPPLEAGARRAMAVLLRDPQAAALVEPVREALLVSTAAQMATGPLMLYHFRELSLIAPLANLLVLPVQPLVMGLGIAAAVGALLLGPLAIPLGWAVWWPLAWSVRVADLAARWPLATVRIAPGYREGMLLAYGAALGFLLLRLHGLSLSEGVRRLRPYRPAFQTLGLIGTVGALAFGYLPDARTLLVLFEDGRTVLLETPEGHRVLWLNGTAASPLPTLGRWLGPFDRRLDLVILGTPEDRRWLDLLQSRYPARYVLGAPGPVPPGLEVRLGAIRLHALPEGWQVRLADRGVWIVRGRPARAVEPVDWVIHPGDERAGLAAARQAKAWGLMVGGAPAGAAASAVSGLRSVWRVRERGWIALWTDGTAWWVGSAR